MRQKRISFFGSRIPSRSTNWSPGFIERLEARFAMDGGGALTAIPHPADVAAAASLSEAASRTTLLPYTLLNVVCHLAGASDADADVQAKFDFPAIPPSPSDSPGPGWKWVGEDPVPGSPRGQWEHPDGRKLHPDLDHPLPKGPHWGVTFPGGNQWDLFPDTGKWVPAKPLNPNKPGFLPPETDSPDPPPVPETPPPPEPAPMQRSPLIPPWFWPAVPAAPRAIPVPSFPLVPLFIIPVFPTVPGGRELA
jgi:hypothetical protein